MAQMFIHKWQTECDPHNVTHTMWPTHCDRHNVTDTMWPTQTNILWLKQCDRHNVPDTMWPTQCDRHNMGRCQRRARWPTSQRGPVNWSTLSIDLLPYFWLIYDFISSGTKVSSEARNLSVANLNFFWPMYPNFETISLINHVIDLWSEENLWNFSKLSTAMM